MRLGRPLSVVLLCLATARAAAADATRVRAVDVAGNERVPAQDLRQLLKTRTGEILSQASLDADREALAARCQADGFLLASVREDVERFPTAQADVLFTVNEGPRFRIKSVEVLGNESLSDAQVTAASGLRPVELLGVLERGYYHPAQITAATERLREHYAERGYLKASVEVDAIEVDLAERGIRVVLRTVEGPRHSIARVVVRGNATLPTEALEREIDLAAGQIFDGRAVEAAAERLMRFYQERSDRVPALRVLERFEAADRVVVVFELDEGRHLFAGTIDVQGNWKTRDRVIRRELAIVPGEPLTRLAIEESQRRLSGLAFFERAEVAARPGAATDFQDLTVRVKERETIGLIEVGGGASSGEGEVGYLRLSQPNFDLFRPPRSLTDWRGAFSGGGQQLIFELVPGTRESEYTFLFREPWLFASSRRLDVQGSSFAFDRGPYDELRLKGSVEVRQFLDRAHHLSAALAHRLELVRIDDVDDSAPPDVLADQGETMLSFPRLSLRWDDRDANSYSGPAGFTFEAGYDIGDAALGSELDFERASAVADVLLPLFDRYPDLRHVLHAGVEVGWAEGRGGDRLPFHERFFLGGPRSLRGFEFRGVGPHQLDTAVGGLALLHGTVEYSLPVVFREIRLAAIFDWGILEDDFDRFSAARIRTAAGGGVQLRLPLLGKVTPINIYALAPLSTQRDDEVQILTFTLGYGF